MDKKQDKWKQESDLLKKYGFKWKKEFPASKPDGTWVLYTPEGVATNKTDALAWIAAQEEQADFDQEASLAYEPTWILNGRSDVYLSGGAHEHPDVIHQRDEGTYLYLNCDYTETKEGDTTRYTLTDGTVFILKGAQFYIEGEEGYDNGL